MKNKSEVEIKGLINKITVGDNSVISPLEWLGRGDNHGLEAHDLSSLVRYLLKKVVELEKKIEDQNILFKSL